jgi:cysteine-S-conjugate beta-lyase
MPEPFRSDVPSAGARWFGPRTSAIVSDSAEPEPNRAAGRRPTGWRTKLVSTEALAPGGFRSLTTPVYRGSTTVARNAETLADDWDHDKAPYSYGLYGTPTTLELAARVCELEHGYRTFMTPGGQAALTLIYFAFTAAGDHVLVPESIYGPSRDFADELLGRYGVEVSYYPPLIGAGIEALIRPNTRLIWCESPGSVTMEIQDVPAIAAAAHRHGAIVAIDNTYSAGVYFDALGHGVDVTMQALTKYVGGHSDLLLGSVTVSDRAGYERVGRTQYNLGQAVSPDDCSLALRGMKTMAVRLDAIERSALALARWFAGRPEIETVLHPALPSCPGHDVWLRDFTGSTGSFSVVFRPGTSRAAINAFADALQSFAIGYSWGGVSSVVAPWSLQQYRGPYGERLVRLYVGLEDTADLIADLEGGLAALARVG